MMMNKFALTAVIQDRKFGIGAAEEGTKGYSPTTYGPFDTWDEAVEFADMVNEQIGLTKEEASKIIIGTMRK